MLRQLILTDNHACPQNLFRSLVRRSLYDVTRDGYDWPQPYEYRGRDMPPEPEIVEVEPRLLLAVQAHVPWREIGTYAMPALDQVWAYIREHNIAGFGHNVFLYENPGPDGADASFGVEVPEGIEVEEGSLLVLTATPAGRVVTMAHAGSYDGLAASNQRLLAWCREKNLELAGPSWEIYGDWDADPARLRTDICFLLKI
jgi:effector-binding domain-containing protein